MTLKLTGILRLWPGHPPARSAPVARSVHASASSGLGSGRCVGQLGGVLGATKEGSAVVPTKTWAVLFFFQSGLRFLCALQSGGKMKTEDNMRRMLEDFCPDGWLWMKMGGLVRLVRGTTLFGAPISSLSSKNSMCLRAPVVCLTPHIHPLSLRDSAELDSFMLTWTTCSQYPTDATRRCVWLRLARSVE